MALIEDRDVFNIVAFEYLDMKDLINLDTAIVEENERAHFLDLMETVPYKPPFHNDLEKWWVHHKECLAWLSRRKMYSPEGAAWHVNKKAWISMLEDPTFDYKPLISQLKNVFFEGFGSPFDLRGLEICDSLETLQLCNYNLVERASSLATCPQLQELILQNSKVCDATLYNFSAVSSLKQLSLRHVTFETLSDELLDHYLRSLQTIKVLNRVFEFFTHFCKRPNHIEIAYFDMLHTTQNIEFDLEPFLKVSPHLRELHIERMCVDVQTLFTLLAQYCPSLEFLHLNHVRLATGGSSAAKIFDSDISFSRLQISTLLPPLDEHFKNILEMTRGKIQHLHISFAERLTDGGLMMARDLCPHLQSFQWDEKLEILDPPSSEGRLDRTVACFHQIPNVKIVLWKKWMAEHLKSKYPTEKTIAYERGTF
jgi:hypothetical protein